MATAKRLAPRDAATADPRSEAILSAIEAEFFGDKDVATITTMIRTAVRAGDTFRIIDAAIYLGALRTSKDMERAGLRRMIDRENCRQIALAETRVREKRIRQDKVGRILAEYERLPTCYKASVNQAAKRLFQILKSPSERQLRRILAKHLGHD